MLTVVQGFYFPDPAAAEKYYNGSILEEEYEMKLEVSCNNITYADMWQDEFIYRQRTKVGRMAGFKLPKHNSNPAILLTLNTTLLCTIRVLRYY